MKQAIVLSVHHLSKQFGRPVDGFLAVSDVSFSVKKGEIVGFLGPNGAGKTTTIQMLLGLMTPTSGEISYFNLPFEKNRSHILSRINYMSGYGKLPWRMTVYENLYVYAQLYEISQAKERILELCKTFEIEDLVGKKFQNLSAGQSTRVMLAKAFLNEPELVLLDEPTASLDPDIAAKIREYILRERKKRKLTIFITSHNMAEVEELCDRVIFLNKGKIYAEDTPEHLAKRYQSCHIKLMVTDGLKRLKTVLEKEQHSYTESNRFVTISLDEQAIGPFLTHVGKLGIEYSDIDIEKPSLEDFFVSLSNGREL